LQLSQAAYRRRSTVISSICTLPKVRENNVYIKQGKHGWHSGESACLSSMAPIHPGIEDHLKIICIGNNVNPRKAHMLHYLFI
jgi:hypothetical protein